MLQSNLSQTNEAAPQSQPQPQPSFENESTQRSQRSHNNRRPNNQIKPWHHFSHFEKLMMFVTFISIVAMAISLITAKINLSNSKRHLQEVNNNITQIHNTNSNLNQEIIELQNSGRLQKIAAKENLSLNNKNIRNVGK